MTTRDNGKGGTGNALEVFKKWIENNKKCLSDLESEVAKCDKFMTSSPNDPQQPTPDLHTMVADGLDKMTKCFNFLEGNGILTPSSTNEQDSGILRDLASRISTLEKESKQIKTNQTSIEQKVKSISSRQEDVVKDVTCIKETIKESSEKVQAKSNEKTTEGQTKTDGIESLKAELRALREQKKEDVNMLQGMVKDLNLKITGVEKDINENQKELAGQITVLLESHNALHSEVNGFGMFHEYIKTRFSEVKVEYNRIEENLIAHDKNMQGLNKSLSESTKKFKLHLTKVSNSLKSEAQERIKDNLSIKEQSQKTDAAIFSLHHSNVNTADQLKTLSEKVSNISIATNFDLKLTHLKSELKTDTQNLNVEVNNLKSEVQSIKQERQQTGSKINDLTNKYNSQAAQMSSLLNRTSNWDDTTRDLNSFLRDSVNDLITRVRVAEKAMCGYQDDANDVRKMQTDIQRQITALSDKHTDFQKSIDKFALFTTSTEKTFVATVEKMDKIEDKLKTAMSDVGRNLGAILTKQSEVNKAQESNVAELKSNVQNLFKFVNENVAVQLKDLNINMDNITRETLHQNARLESLETFTDEISGACQGLELDLTQTKSHVESITQQSGKTEFKISELVQKNDNLNKSTISNLQTFSTKLDSAIQEFTLHLNKELMNLKKVVDDSLSQVRYLESEIKDTQSGKKAIGFTASPNNLSSVRFKEGEVVKHFSNIVFNEGKYYDLSTGSFTAPVAGLYYTSLTVSKINQGRINLHVKHRPVNAGRGDRKVKIVCRAHSGIDDNSSTGSGLAYLEKGDALYVVSVNVSHDAALNCYSSFSCFLVKG